MTVKRFQVKLAGSEAQTMDKTGRIVGWKVEFFTCQPAAVSLIVNEQQMELAEGQLIPATSLVRLKFEGEKTATAGVQLVLEEA